MQDIVQYRACIYSQEAADALSRGVHPDEERGRRQGVYADAEDDPYEGPVWVPIEEATSYLVAPDISQQAVEQGFALTPDEQLHVYEVTYRLLKKFPC